MVRPERRTKADLAAVAAILVAALVGGLVLWQSSDVHATVSETARAPAAPQPPITSLPATLSEAWQAPSPATPKPIVTGPDVVTGQGNEVLGHDPATGAVRWRYARDIPLCTIGTEWDRAIAVYRKSHNCSEVTALQGGSGRRGPQRDSDAEFGTQLLSDGTHVTATGNKLIETWRSDLVRTQQYGVPTDIKNSGNNLRRPQCQYTSVAVNDDRVGVIEKCPGASSDRVTVIKSHPQDDEKPDETLSTLTGSTRASVVAVSKTRVAVLLQDRGELVIFQKTGSIESRFPFPAPKDHPGIEHTVTSGDLTYWYTGSETVALDNTTFHPLWTLPGTLGPGRQIAGKLVVPVKGGLSVHDLKTGAPERVIPVDRKAYNGYVGLATVGNTILEQRSDTLVALH